MGDGHHVHPDDLWILWLVTIIGWFSRFVLSLRSIRYQEVYLNDNRDRRDAFTGLEAYFGFCYTLLDLKQRGLMVSS